MFLESYWSAVGRVDHRKLSPETSCPLTRLELICHIVIKASFVFLISFDQEPRFRRNKMQQEYTFTSSTILLLQRKQLYEKILPFRSLIRSDSFPLCFLDTARICSKDKLRVHVCFFCFHSFYC